METAEIELLGKVIAKELRRAETEDPLMLSEEVAALISCEPRTVTEHFAKLEGFPKAILLGAGEGRAKARPRWRRSAILSWIAGHECESSKPRRGRPRNKVDD